MSTLKKGVAALVAAAVLTVPLAVSATGNNANINVSATVKATPQANLTVNFDGLNFIGTVGDTAVAPTYTKNGVAGSNTVDLTARGNYTLMVSGLGLATLSTPPADPWAPPTPTPPPVNLDSKRVKVAIPNTGTLIPLTNMPTIIDQGAGDVIKAQKALNFTLDLSYPVYNPATGMDNYSDMGFWDLDTSAPETNLFTQVTLSFTSM